jgi:hypothetical protein
MRTTRQQLKWESVWFPRMHAPQVSWSEGPHLPVTFSWLGRLMVRRIAHIALSGGPTHHRSSGPLNREIDGSQNPSHADGSALGGFGNNRFAEFTPALERLATKRRDLDRVVREAHRKEPLDSSYKI